MSLKDLIERLAKLLDMSPAAVSDLLSGMTQKNHIPFASVPFEEKMAMRDAVAKERAKMVGKPCPVWGHLSEPDAAVFLSRNHSTLRRAREAGLLKPGKHYVPLGERGLRYGVWQLCDIWLFGVEGWEDDTPPENGGSPNAGGSGSGAASTSGPDKPSASAFARKTLKKPK